MSRAVKQPVGQKRLTNIAVVRYKTHGLRFEIACYKNKVFDWRQGSEQDLDEVLQTEQVFVNVSKGVMAKEKDLKKAFGKNFTMEEVCKEILKKGELQVSDRERALQLDSRLRDVASIIVEKCVDSNTRRPFPHALVERALKDPKIRFIPDNRKSAKQQMLDVVPRLQKQGVLSIERARMRVQLTVFAEEMRSEVLARLGSEPLRTACQVEREEASPSGSDGTYQCAWVMQIEPGSFRAIDSIARGEKGTGNAGRLEVLDLAVHGDQGRAAEEAEQMAEGAARGMEAVRIDDGVSCVPDGKPPQPERAEAPALVGRFKCNTCQVAFDDKKEHREHFKSDWHRINLKRKSKKEPPLSREECEAIALMESTASSDLNDFAF